MNEADTLEWLHWEITVLQSCQRNKASKPYYSHRPPHCRAGRGINAVSLRATQPLHHFSYHLRLATTSRCIPSSKAATPYHCRDMLSSPKFTCLTFLTFNLRFLLHSTFLVRIRSTASLPGENWQTDNCLDKTIIKTCLLLTYCSNFTCYVKAN